MIFIYTPLPENREPYKAAMEVAYDEDRAARVARHFPKSIFFFAELAPPEEEHGVHAETHH